MSEVATAPKNEVTIIFEKISTGLQAFEERKAALIQLREEASGIKVTTYEDKATLKKATEVRKKLKAARVEIEKEGKAMRDPLTGVNREITAKEKELTDIISPTEKDLKTVEDWYEFEKNRIYQEAAEMENERIQSRINQLAEYGYEIDLNMLKGISDEQFEKVVANAKSKFEKEQSAKEEQALKEAAQREQDEKDRAELKALREKQEAHEKALIERQEAIDRKERAIKDKEEQEAAHQREKAQAEEKTKLHSRLSQLTALGLKFNFSANQYEGFACAVHYFDITGYDDEKWDGMIAKMGPHIEAYKKEESDRAETKRQEELKEAAKKALAEQKEREAEATRQEAEKIAASSDKDKVALVITQIEGINYPDMKSAKGKKLMAEVKELEAKVIAHIKARS